MKRYEIYYARLEPVEGSEIGKTRPTVRDRELRCLECGLADGSGLPAGDEGSSELAFSNANSQWRKVC